MSSDGMLGWPGLGKGASNDWFAVSFNDGDTWYAPKSGWFYFTGCGAGGGMTSGAGVGGGGGAALVNCPIWLPEGIGGGVVLGKGVTGANGGDTSLGDVLILGGGKSGANGGAKGVISGWAFRNAERPVIGLATNGVNPNGGMSGPLASSLVDPILLALLSQNFSITPPSTSVGNGTQYGGGAYVALASYKGGDGFLSVLWCGA